MDTILIVDDEKNYTRIMQAVLEEEGFETIATADGAKALSVLARSDVDLILTDMKMPGIDGISLLEAVKAKAPDLPVMMMTAHGTVEKAVEAMQKGAYHYLTKPFDNEELVIYARKAIATYRLVRENRSLRSAFRDQYGFGNIIGKSRAMRAVFELIRKVAPTTATVLIEGESGTGKELVAKSIHYNSPRHEQPFVAVNCAALSENLLESELFGHEKGAFTGAAGKRKGRFELADGGSLFLDEIGEISTAVQVKLLRVLQEKTFERVGGVRPVNVDIRLIAATNQRLQEQIEKRLFREDLYYRLNVVNIQLPPLRGRRADLHLLIRHFIEKYAAERTNPTEVKGVSQTVERLFHEYPWPGNVRELENVIERAMILSPGGLIEETDLPKTFRNQAKDALHLDGIPREAKLYETLAMVEQTMIRRALQVTNNVQSHAAEMLGIGKSGLHQKIKKYQIDLNNLD